MEGEMTRSNVGKAKALAKKFIAACDEMQSKQPPASQVSDMIFASKESGALRRASMDLTRALAELRKP